MLSTRNLARFSRVNWPLMEAKIRTVMLQNVDEKDFQLNVPVCMLTLPLEEHSLKRPENFISKQFENRVVTSPGYFVAMESGWATKALKLD